MKELTIHRLRLTDDEAQALSKSFNIAQTLIQCDYDELSSLGKLLSNTIIRITNFNTNEDVVGTTIVNDFTVDGNPYSEDIMVD